MEPFREKNNNVKPACHKIYQGMHYLLIFSFKIFIFCCNPLDVDQTLSECLLAQRSVSNANGSFVLLNFKSLRKTGWLKNAKIASVTTDNVSFI